MSATIEESSIMGQSRSAEGGRDKGPLNSSQAALKRHQGNCIHEKLDGYL